MRLGATGEDSRPHFGGWFQSQLFANLLGTCGLLQWWLRFFTSLALSFACDCPDPPTKDGLFYALNLGWSCDLFQPIESIGSNGFLVPSPTLKRSACFYLLSVLLLQPQGHGVQLPGE